MIVTPANEYDVVLQRNDGQIVQKLYAVRWDPKKVGPVEVAQACAAECGFFEGGRVNAQTGEREFRFAPISATLLEKAEPEPVAA